VECKLRSVNFRRVSDPRSAFLPAFRVTGISDDWYRSTMGVIVISLGAPERTLGAPGSTGDKPGSAEDNPGSTWERQRQVWERLESQ